MFTMKPVIKYFVLIIISNFIITKNYCQNSISTFDFEGNTKNEKYEFVGKGFTFERGIDGRSLFIQSNNTEFNNVTLQDLSFDGKKSFTVQFWLNSKSKKPSVLISQKEFLNKGILSQKNKGWVLYSSNGTLAWSIGSGKRRLNYERDNGNKMELADGAWHQITMTYKKESSEVRLYQDGQNIGIYNEVLIFLIRIQ